MSETITINKKAVIYCRVSTKEQVEDGNSLVLQERLCYEYATKEGYEVVKVFIEKGESAKTAKRTELNHLLSFCTAKKGIVQAVIAYKVDRISRNITDYSNIKVRLKKADVTIKSVTEYFEDTPAGRFMENIIANVGQFDNDVRAERSMDGMKEAVQEGRYVWKAPPGYSNLKINGKNTIAPNANAPLIKEAFELITKRVYATEEIRSIVTQKGLVNSKGTPIFRSHFFRLLRNPMYKGKIKKFGKVYQGTFEPIVSEDLFDEVQSILKGRMNKVKYYKHDHPDFPLRRFVVNEDGKQLTGYWAQGRRLKYPYYSFHLPGTTIRKELLEQKFKEFLAHYTFDSKHLKIIRGYLIKHFGKHLDREDTHHKTIEKQIADLNAQIDNLIKLENAGNISTTILTGRVSKLDAEINELQGLLKEKKNTDIDVPNLLTFAFKVLKEPYKLWQTASLEIQKKLQVFDFPEGIIFDGVNFRTTKVCSIFNLKEQIDELKSTRVSSEYSEKNNLRRRNSPPSEINLLETKVFWEGVVTELKALEVIIAGKGEKPTEEEFEFREF